jgi:hypothetical protein
MKQSKNLFRDLLGSPDHVELKSAHDAAASIRKIAIDRGLSATALAETLEMPAATIEKILVFKLGGISRESLETAAGKLSAV